MGKLSVSWHFLSPEWTVSRQKQTEWWTLVGAVEQHAGQHPLTVTITRESGAQTQRASDSTAPVSVTCVRYKLGKGVQGWIVLDDRPPVHVAVGSRGFLKSMGIEPDVSSVPEAVRSDVATTVCVAIDENYAGILVC